MKTCSNCNIPKEEHSFYKDKTKKDGLCYQCIKCMKEQKREYYQTTKEQKREYYLNNKEKILEQKKEYLKNNKEYIQKYRHDNKDKLKEYRQEYYQTNREKLIRTKARYARERRHKDSAFAIVGRLRCRINYAIKGNHKSTHTKELIGCSTNKLKEHLQSTAISNGYQDFDINNYSGREYHIDHIIPCSAWNLSCSYHQKLCFHYTNLQILSAKDNLLKKDYI